LYSTNFTKKSQIVIVQTETNCVETVKSQRPLTQALAVATKSTNQLPSNKVNDGNSTEVAMATQFTVTKPKPIVLSSASLPDLPPVLTGFVNFEHADVDRLRKAFLGFPPLTFFFALNHSTPAAGAPINVAKAQQLAKQRLRENQAMKASPDMRWQYKWTCE
jgi:hypothetical protein